MMSRALFWYKNVILEFFERICVHIPAQAGIQKKALYSLAEHRGLLVHR